MSAPDPSFQGESLPDRQAGLAAFACPNPRCRLLNRFGAGNLSVVEQGLQQDADQLNHIHRH